MENKDVNSFFGEKLEQVQNEKIEVEKTDKKKKKSLKAIIIAAIAALLAGLGVLTWHLVSKNKKATPNDTNSNTSSIITVDDLGMEEDFTSSLESKEYGKTTGDVDKNKIVEKDGTIWKDKEAADKSKDIGKTTIDDKNGTLKVNSDGEVYEKEKGYEIQKEDGTVVSGTNGTGEPTKDDGYVYDKELDSTVVKDDVNKFVNVDKNYYNKYTGKIVYSKGERVLKETLAKIKKDPNLTTTKPVLSNSSSVSSSSKVSSTSSSSSTTSSSSATSTSSTSSVTDSLGGVVNKNGTYTIYFKSEDGKIPVTYMDKATYQSWLLDENAEENFGQYLDGIIYPKSVIDEMYSQKIKTK